MSIDPQNLAALAVVLAALVYLARRLLRRGAFTCGGCAAKKCSAGKEEQLITLSPPSRTT